MDDEREREQTDRLRSYRACALGFSLYGVNLAASTFVGVVELVLLFTLGFPNLGPILGIDAFHFRFDAFRAWERVFACLALAAAWPGGGGWRRRAGLLAAMAVADVALWASTEAVALGLAAQPTRHLIFYNHLRTVLGWSRFFLIVGLSSDMAHHAGDPHAGAFGRTALRTARVGAGVWFAYFLTRFDWSHPWPLVERPPGPAAIQLMVASYLVGLLCMAQSALLAIAAALASWRMAPERFHPGSAAWSS
jgi:hypothetical protein